MNITQFKNDFRDTFSWIEFESKSHTYTGVKGLIPATTFKKGFKKPFLSKYWATYKALQANGITVLRAFLKPYWVEYKCLSTPVEILTCKREAYIL